MALLVFAGSSQLAAMPLILAGAPAWVILATAFCVNLRFVVFSLHLRPYMMHLPLWRRLLGGYLIADLTYVLFTKRYPHPVSDASIATKSIASSADSMAAAGSNSLEYLPAERSRQQAYLLGSSLLNWGSWVSSSLVGIALANVIPQSWGLGFAGILALIGIACSLATSRLRIVSALVAGSAGVAAFALPLRLNIMVAIAVAVIVCMSLERFRSQLEPAK